jgi:ribonucleoside-diphosphate reductase alpha chain
LILCDTLIDLEVVYVNKIIEKIQNGKDPQEFKDSEITIWKKILDKSLRARRVGCGFSGLADMLATLGIPFNINAITTIKQICDIKMESELSATIDLAILYGAFSEFDINLEYTFFDTGVVKGNNNFAETIRVKYNDLFLKMIKYGRRNISFSTVAPTGTISMLAQINSGIEPLLMPMYLRRVKINDDNNEYNYVDPNDGCKYLETPVIHKPLIDWYETVFNKKFVYTNEKEFNEIFAESPYFKSCAYDITWQDRLKIQFEIQDKTSHAISSTINLPADTPKETISKIYLESWKGGLKGQTIYREGSRSGIIVNINDKKKKDVMDEIVDANAPKRPYSLKAHYYTIFVSKENSIKEYKLTGIEKIVIPYSIIIGFLKNRPFEIFIISNMDKKYNVPIILNDKARIDGNLIKEYKNWYNFESDSFLLRDLPDGEHDEKLLSMNLSIEMRSGIPLQFIIKTIKKTQPLIGSFGYKLCKILSYYVQDGTSEGGKCPDCGGLLTYEAGCVICKSCGYSVC